MTRRHFISVAAAEALVPAACAIFIANHNPATWDGMSTTPWFFSSAPVEWVTLAR